VKKTIGIFFCILQFLFASAQSSKTDSLLHALDNILQNQEVYIRQKNEKINFLKKELAGQCSPERRHELNNRIIQEYQYYISDSVMRYVDHNRILAEQTKNFNWQTEYKIQRSFYLSSVGLFLESQEILESIPVDRIPENLRLEYYKCRELFCVHMLEYINDSRFTEPYKSKALLYRDSVLSYLPKGSADYLFWSFKAKMDRGKSAEARQDLTKCLRKLQFGTHAYAGACYCMSIFYNEYNGGQEREDKLELLINASMSDIQTVTKENMALMALALFLYNAGDTQRANKYTLYALDDANFYNARYRNFQIGQMMPIIEKSYQHKIGQQQKRLRIFSFGTSILSLMLIFLVLSVRKQMKRLAKARISLNQMNEDLQKLNTNLQEMNTNLNEVNFKLSESNEVKVEYIGRFLDLCSNYIDKIEDYQKLVSRKIVAGQVDELYRIASSPRTVEKELKSLYENFDNAFLQIYPRFIQQFNALLREDSRCKPRNEEKLNTELRTFALIRLGITDNAKIAAFLRCSIQTVYNYRCKKGKALDESEELEEQVKRIGNL